MKVNGLNNALNIYKNNKSQKTNNSTVSSKVFDKKTEDTIQISSNYEMSANIDKLSKKITDDIEGSNRKQQLLELKEAIKNNNYNIQSSFVANSILDRYL